MILKVKSIPPKSTGSETPKNAFDIRLIFVRMEHGWTPFPTSLLTFRNLKITNLYASITSIEEFENPNEVKVVLDCESNALYFSREPIPSRKKGVIDVPMYKQVCVIPFKRDFLLEYNEMEQTQLEIIESVDMMRLLENGIKVKMVYM